MPIRFYLDKRADKNGDNPIRVSISLNGERFVTSTGFNISPEKWDIKKQRVKSKYSNAKGETSTIINTLLNEIDNHFARIEAKLKIKDLKAVDIRAEYSENFGRIKIKKDKSFFEHWDEFTAEMGKENNWTKAVYDKFGALKNHLQNFKPDITFEFFTKDGLNDFVDYLHNVQLGSETGMRNTTIKKQLGFLKWFLRWAMNKGYTTETSFLTFKPKLTTTENKVIFLDWDELMTVYNFPIPETKKYLERVRDVFCFCCFTSLRYSDVANLKRSNIDKNYIRITTIKTADTLNIDLNDYSRAILDKYKDETFPFDRALPVISNQRMNEYLKELGELCGLDKPETITYYKGNKRYDEVYPKYALIGTHTARRTFISNALMLGIPPQVVMKWTGHSDYKAMKPYIDIADKAKADAMKMFNNKK